MNYFTGIIKLAIGVLTIALLLDTLNRDVPVVTRVLDWGTNPELDQEAGAVIETDDGLPRTVVDATDQPDVADEATQGTRGARGPAKIQQVEPLPNEFMVPRDQPPLRQGNPYYEVPRDQRNIVPYTPPRAPEELKTPLADPPVGSGPDPADSLRYLLEP